MKKAASVFFAILLFGATCSTSKAQDLGGALDLGMLGRDLSFSASMRAQANRDAARLKGRSNRTQQKRRVAAKGSTRFKTNFAVRQRNLARFIADVRRVSPKEGVALQQNFAKGDPIAMVAPGLRRYNLRTDDVADAATAYLVSAWYGARGRNDDPPQIYVDGVRTQMRSAMLSIPKFVSASDSAKQQMAEMLLLQTMVTDALVTASKGNAAQMAKAKASIAKGASSSFQLDLAKLKLTSRGLHR